MKKTEFVQLHAFGSSNVGAPRLIFPQDSSFGRSLIHYPALRFEDEELELTIDTTQNGILRVIFKSPSKQIDFTLETYNLTLKK